MRTILLPWPNNPPNFNPGYGSAFVHTLIMYERGCVCLRPSALLSTDCWLPYWWRHVAKSSASAQHYFQNRLRLVSARSDLHVCGVYKTEVSASIGVKARVFAVFSVGPKDLPHPRLKMPHMGWHRYRVAYNPLVFTFLFLYLRQLSSGFTIIAEKALAKTIFVF